MPSTWYLVATGNINSSAPFASSSGGAGGAGTPTTGDTIICDGNSGSANLTINAAISLASLDCQGGTGNFAGTITHSAFTLTITGTTNALRFSSGMTYTPSSVSSLVTFTATSGTQQITSAGKVFAAITQNGAGGTTQQQDNLAVNALQNSILTLTNGTWDCNGNSLTVPIFSSNNSNTRAFKMGSSITIGGNISTTSVIWQTSTITNFTLTKNSCNITVLAPSTNIAAQSLAFGGLTINGLTINAITGQTQTDITASLTCSSLSVGSGNSLWLTTSITVTVSSAFTLIGTASAPIFIGTGVTTNSSIAAISCSTGSCTLDWGIISALTASGGATFTATNTLAVGTNSGWSITPPADATTSGIAASTATAVWQDLLSSSDFSTSSSVGALLKAASNLQYTVAAIGRGTVTSGASTTSIPTSAYTPATSASVANQLVGGVVYFDANTTTVALRGQRATISASSASATPTLTVSTLTATPASGDTFSVI